MRYAPFLFLFCRPLLYILYYQVGMNFFCFFFFIDFTTTRFRIPPWNWHNLALNKNGTWLEFKYKTGLKISLPNFVFKHSPFTPITVFNLCQFIFFCIFCIVFISSRHFHLNWILHLGSRIHGTLAEYIFVYNDFTFLKNSSMVISLGIIDLPMKRHTLHWFQSWNSTFRFTDCTDARLSLEMVGEFEW